jgi:hypothetical protein
MNTGLLLACTSLVSAGAAYFLDPLSGHRRRIMLRDRFVRYGHDALDFMNVSRRDLKNRTMGLYGEARYHLRGKDVLDDQLEERVRSKLGHFVSHPRAITVTAHEGTVTLSGIAFSHEIRKALRAVRKIPGVRDVVSELEGYPPGTNIPALQGGLKKSRHTYNLLQENWSPATRVLAGAAGASLAADSLRRSKYVMAGEAAVGFGLLMKSFTNRTYGQAVTPKKQPEPQSSSQLTATVH